MPEAHTRPTLHTRRAPMPVLLAVLALHLLLLGLAAQLGVWRERGPLAAPSHPLMLWLLDAQAPRQPATAESTPTAPPRRSRTPSPETPRSETQAITLPALPADAQAAPANTPDTREVPPAAGTATAAPLNLALPRAASAPWRQRNPALDDARANTPRRTMETLIAQALGGDPYGAISEEHLADGSVRFRRGSQCVISRPNQAQNIDPYNGSVMPKPRLLDKC